MTVVISTGHLDENYPLRIIGLVDHKGKCRTVRVIDLFDQKPISWALSEQALSDFRRVIERKHAA